jgi:hypothetical protein
MKTRLLATALPLVTVISTVNGRTTYEEYDANPGTWVINIADRMRMKCWGGGGGGNGQHVSLSAVSLLLCVNASDFTY